MLRYSRRVLALMAGLAFWLPTNQADAAGARGGGVARHAPAPLAKPHHGLSRHAMLRGQQHRGWRRGAQGWESFLPFDDGFLSYPAGYMRGDEIPLTRRAPSPPADPDSFEGMPVRVGIPRAPTPEPTLYRLEGSRSRPVVRVIRVADAQPGRYSHGETGALLLTVPPRR